MVQVDDAEIYRKHAGELIRFANALAGPSGAEDVLALAVMGNATARERASKRGRRIMVNSESMRGKRARGVVGNR